MYSGTVARSRAGPLAQRLDSGAHDCIGARASTGGPVATTERWSDAPLLQLSTTVAQEVTSSVVNESQQHELASMAAGNDSVGVADRMSAGGVQQHARMTVPVYRHTINVSGRATSWLEKRSARRRASCFMAVCVLVRAPLTCKGHARPAVSISPDKTDTCQHHQDRAVCLERSLQVIRTPSRLVFYEGAVRGVVVSSVHSASMPSSIQRTKRSRSSSVAWGPFPIGNCRGGGHAPQSGSAVELTPQRMVAESRATCSSRR